MAPAIEMFDLIDLFRPPETPMRLVREALDGLCVPYVQFNQRPFADMAMEFELRDSQGRGQLWAAGRAYRLGDSTDGRSPATGDAAGACRSAALNIACCMTR